MITFKHLAFIATVIFGAGFDISKLNQCFPKFKQKRIDRLKEYIEAYLLVKNDVKNFYHPKAITFYERLICFFRVDSTRAILNNNTSFSKTWSDGHWRTFTWLCIFFYQNEINHINEKKSFKRQLSSCVHILALKFFLKEFDDVDTQVIPFLNSKELDEIRFALDNNTAQFLSAGLKNIYFKLVSNKFSNKDDCREVFLRDNQTQSQKSFISELSNQNDNTDVIKQIEDRRKLRREHSRKVEIIATNFSTIIVTLMMASVLFLLFFIRKDSYEFGIAWWHCLLGALLNSFAVVVVLGAQLTMQRRFTW